MGISDRATRMCLLLLAVGLSLACSSHPKLPPSTPAPLIFPPGFLWSVSTAAEQSEGRNTTNDWYVFEGMGRVPPVGWADDMVDLYDADFGRAQAMGCNAFRLTFEWGRLVPTAPANPLAMTSADFDPTAVAYYHSVLSSLKAHNLTPLVTLTHYTLPVWVDDPAAVDAGTYYSSSMGAWTNPDTAVAFASYAGAVATEFGTEVTYWLTENEPELDLVDGYMVGLFPPGFKDLSLAAASLPGPDGGISAAQVLKNMIAGHAGAYHAIHAAEPTAKVSIAHNSIDFEASSTAPAEIAAEQRFEFLYDDLYLDAATSGNFDTGLIGQGPLESHPDWAGTMDFIGVNFYFRNYVVEAQIFDPVDAIPCNPLIGSYEPLADFGCPTDALPEPQGLTNILLHYHQRYNLPLLITENGTEDPDGTDKAAYLVQNLMAVHSAIEQGAQVLGYSYWTLNDDYEWADGYQDHFGLFSVTGLTNGADGGLPAASDGGRWSPDSSTDFTRVPYEPAVSVYAAMADAGAISAALVAQYAPDGG